MIIEIKPLINNNNNNILTKLYSLIENINSVYELYDAKQNTGEIKQILINKQKELKTLLRQISIDNQNEGEIVSK